MNLAVASLRDDRAIGDLKVEVGEGFGLAKRPTCLSAPSELRSGDHCVDLVVPTTNFTHWSIFHRSFVT